MAWYNPVSWFVTPVKLINIGIDKVIIPALDKILGAGKPGWKAAAGVIGLVVTWAATNCIGWGFDGATCEVSNHVADVINIQLKNAGVNLYDVSITAVVYGILDKIKRRTEVKTEVKVLREVNGLPPAKEPFVS